MLPRPHNEAHAAAFGDIVVVVDAHAGDIKARASGSIVVGVDRRGDQPSVRSELFDILLTTGRDPSREWVGVADIDVELATLRKNAREHPLAASILAQVLRVTSQSGVEDALIVESLAYSTLLAGREFRDWRNSRLTRLRSHDTDTRIRTTRDQGVLCIHLANPQRLNAFDARMRDDLVEALHAALDDPTMTALQLRGDGKAFSSGGDLDEFGSAPDAATAHAVRTLRSPALLVHQIGERATAYVHGACVGAGIEIPAAAHRVVADAGSWFALPEIGMGLIPGAGGTVSVPQRIGRHRTLHWALSGRRLDAQTALRWGLIDEIGSVA